MLLWSSNCLWKNLKRGINVIQLNISVFVSNYSHSSWRESSPLDYNKPSMSYSGYKKSWYLDIGRFIYRPVYLPASDIAFSFVRGSVTDRSSVWCRDCAVCKYFSWIFLDIFLAAPYTYGISNSNHFQSERGCLPTGWRGRRFFMRKFSTLCLDPSHEQPRSKFSGQNPASLKAEILP